MNIDISNENDNGEDVTSAKQVAALLAAIGPLSVGGGQLLPGRSRKCCFWISRFVADGRAYIVDTNSVPSPWPHNPAGDAVPDDTLLVIISPRHEDHIRKAMATWKVPVGPAYVAARIIDDECRKDASLAVKLRWKVAAA